MNMEINHRIKIGNKCYYGLQKLLRSKLLKKERQKGKIYEIVKPIVLYGSESWILTKLNEKLKKF
jgi:hypothetical protein